MICFLWSSTMGNCILQNMQFTSVDTFVWSPCLYFIFPASPRTSSVVPWAAIKAEVLSLISHSATSVLFLYSSISPTKCTNSSSCICTPCTKNGFNFSAFCFTTLDTASAMSFYHKLLQHIVIIFLLLMLQSQEPVYLLKCDMSIYRTMKYVLIQYISNIYLYYMFFVVYL